MEEDEYKGKTASEASTAAKKSMREVNQAIKDVSTYTLVEFDISTIVRSFSFPLWAWYSVSLSTWKQVKEIITMNLN